MQHKQRVEEQQNLFLPRLSDADSRGRGPALLCGHLLHRLSKTARGWTPSPSSGTAPNHYHTSPSINHKRLTAPESSSVRADRKRGESRKQQEMAAGAGQRLLLSVHQGKGGAEPSAELRRHSPLQHLHLLVVEQHPIHGLDGPSCCLVSLKVNKAVATGSVFITNHLQTQSKALFFPLTCTGVNHRKTNPHFPGALSLPDILLPQRLSCTGCWQQVREPGESSAPGLPRARCPAGPRWWPSSAVCFM